eukprot:scaffold93605_cov37-Tisochrysis_lutea.AAC.3
MGVAVGPSAPRKTSTSIMGHGTCPTPPPSYRSHRHASRWAHGPLLSLAPEEEHKAQRVKVNALMEQSIVQFSPYPQPIGLATPGMYARIASPLRNQDC